MFAQLKGVLDLLRSGILAFRKFKSERDRNDVVLDILRIYFLLKDCVDEGEELIEEAGPHPIELINAMGESEAWSTLGRWGHVLRRQGLRLSMLARRIFAQDHLAVTDPKLQDQISDAIGDKTDSAVSLHGIGAALFYRELSSNTKEAKASYVATMAGMEDDTLNMERLRSEINALREALDQYRGVLERLVTTEELLRLSRQARSDITLE
jgi:hypothetical protein